MRVENFRLLFFGSDAFSIRVLKPLLDKKLCPVQVVTKLQTSLYKFSQQHNVTTHQWLPGLPNVSDDEFNIGLVASFGQMIDPVTVRKFHLGLFNTHPSLLPQYRGSTPVQAAVFDGLKETGCTIMRIPPVEKFDIGDIISQKKLAIGPREYAIELRDRLADLGSSMVIDFLLNYEQYIVTARSQCNENKSLARKLKREQGCLQFKTESMDFIDRKVLAYTGFIEIYTICLGGLHVELDGFREPKLVEKLNLDRLVSKLTENPNIEAGTLFFHRLRRILCVKAHDGKWAAFEYATPRGKPKMDALDFYNGYLSKVELRLRMTDV